MESKEEARKIFRWEDITLVNENKENGNFGVLPTDKSTQSESPYDISLNGEWKFKWLMGDKPEKGFERITFDDSGWDSVTLPGVWQMSGYGTPYYYASGYPQAIGTKKNRIPQISHKLQEIGIYRKHFDFPREDFGRRVFIRFGAVKAALELYINGCYVGYSLGSMTPHEFDITEYVSREKNLVTAVVYRYSTGTYIEDQDMWFMSGIYRDINVYSEDEICLRDAFVTAEPVDEGKGVVRVKALVKNYGAQCPARLTVRIKGHGLEQEIGVADFTAESESSIEFEKELQDIKLWSDEEPNLYQISFKLEANRKTSCKTVNTGFRKVEIDGNVLKLNGKRILLRGVNRHDFTPDNGWAVPKETIERDLLLMKQFNVNAIRTSHYPNTPYLYELCDKLGLLVMDECDNESHGVRDFLPGSDPRWTPHCVDRMKRMVLRDRNHPCIIIWSLGNEAGEGSNFFEMKNAALELDQSRPIHYEGYYDKRCTDFISRMYPGEDEEKCYAAEVPPRGGKASLIDKLANGGRVLDPELCKTMPVVMCEYAHCLENSLGNFKEHMAQFESSDNMAGGFVWDYVDQAILRKTDNGKQWLYGIDFPEIKSKYGYKSFVGSHGCFCANGVIGADRNPHPAAAELTRVYQRIEASISENGELEIQNKYHTISLDGFTLNWRLHSEAAGELASGDICLKDINIKAGEKKRISLPLPDCSKQSGVLLDLLFKNNDETPWGEVGFVQARVQLELTDFSPIESKPAGKAPELEIKGRNAAIRGNGFEYRFDNGVLCSAKVNGEERLSAPLLPNWFRPQTDNDRGYVNFIEGLIGFVPGCKWLKVVKKQRCTSFKASKKEESIVITTKWKAKGIRSCGVEYRISSGGEIKISLLAKTGSSVPMRIGMTTAVPAMYSDLEYFGRGPVDNYIDRKTGSLIGRYETTVKALGHGYMRPQENAHRCDVSLLKLKSGAKSVTFRATGERFEFNALPHSLEALDKAAHLHELADEDKITLCIDGIMQGVGGDIPGMARLMRQYSIHENSEYKCEFELCF